MSHIRGARGVMRKRDLPRPSEAFRDETRINTEKNNIGENQCKSVVSLPRLRQDKLCHPEYRGRESWDFSMNKIVRGTFT